MKSRSAHFRIRVNIQIDEFYLINCTFQEEPGLCILICNYVNNVIGFVIMWITF